MKLVERYIIKKSNDLFKPLDELCFKSKNLYNQGLYRVRLQYFLDKTFKNYNALNKELHDENQIDYRALPANVSQEILKIVEKNYISFFKLIKIGCKQAKIPKYLDKKKGRQILVYNHMTLSKQYLNKGIIKLPKTNIEIRYSKKHDILQVRIIPLLEKGSIAIEIVYNVLEKPMKYDNYRYMSIDLGISNLATCTSNVIKTFIINGKAVKQINLYYNKKKAKIQKDLSKQNKSNKPDIQTSKRLQRLSLKRYNKINDYFHKSSTYIVNQLVNNNINTLIIGKNNDWKQETNMGKKNNQNFISIPHNKFILMLKYKCFIQGINVIILEESYTSKCSYLDNDYIPSYGANDIDLFKPSGKRQSRGLYISKDGIKLNADVNGSLNIMRKYLINVTNEENQLIHPVDIGLMVNPIRINF